MGPDKLRRITYIEDDPVMIDLVKMILYRHGYEVKGAHGGRAGLELIHADPPDLILLDLMMPDVDGWDVYQQIKSDPTTAMIPVIIITAKAQPIDKVLGLNVAKVDGYICKPFRPQELLDNVEKMVTARQ